MIPFPAILGLKEVLTSPKVIACVAVAALVVFGVYKWNSAQNRIESLEKDVKVEQTQNTLLRSTITSLDTESKNKDATIQQLNDSAKLQQTTIASLSKSVAQTNKAVNDLKGRFDAITTPPTQDIGPYLKSALDGVKTLNGEK